jgi:hypothetical protein
MRHQRIAPSTIAILAAAALTGCGISDPYAGKPPSTSRSTSTATSTPATTNADPPPERGGTISPAARVAQARLAAGAGRPTPQAALERYARLYVNWTAATIEPIQQQLATLSIGEARAQALQAAASYARDQTLAQSRVANSGRLIAITPSLDAGGQWVIVTSEHTTGAGDYSGLPPTLHVIYAQVARAQAGWVVSEWAPQN